MKTSLVIAIALIVSGVGLALLRYGSTAPVAQTSDTPPPQAQPMKNKRLPTTGPALTLASADEDKPPMRRLVAHSGRGLAPAARASDADPSAAEPATVGDADQVVPMAREALISVGTDADANEFWATAINDPDLSGEERSNLIEDLNEAGFADPARLTANDLPLIESRLELIESLAPDAMDDTNAAAFAEAYKDLSKMHDDLESSTTPQAGVQLTVR